MFLQAIFLPGFNSFFVNVGTLDLILKWLFVIGFGLYVVFAFIVTRQISIMRSTLISTFSYLLTVVGYIHLLIAIIFFLGIILFV